MKLKSLHIQNFRALEDFTVQKLGRLNLIVGKNNSGKSSVLEALRIYAGNANRALLDEIAKSHDEPVHSSGQLESAEALLLPYQSLFKDRRFPEGDTSIRIGEIFSNNILEIGHVFIVQKMTNDPSQLPLALIKTAFNEKEYVKKGQGINILKKSSNDSQTFGIDIDSMRFYGGGIEEFKRIPCAYIPTAPDSLETLADIWDRVQLFPEYAEFVKKSLEIIEPDLQNVAFVKSEMGSLRRIATAKLKYSSILMPLKSMGDGMLRVLQLVLKVFLAKGGFLLIDEFENGLHFSVQEKVWHLLFELAEQLDIQVFATTHSWDCIESFAKVAIQHENTEGVLFRVGRSVRTSDNGKIIATEFNEEQLANLTQADVEVR